MPLAQERLAKLETLTPREMEVLQCLRNGLSSEEVAAKLFISPPTARFHISNIYVKLDLDKVRRGSVRQRELVKYLELLGKPSQVIASDRQADIVSVPTPSAAVLAETSAETRSLDAANLADNSTDQHAAPVKRPPQLKRTLAFGLAMMAAGALLFVIIPRIFSSASPLVPLATVTNSAMARIAGATIAPTRPSGLSQVESANASKNGLCGESKRIPLSDAPRFLQSQGISLFTPENTDGAVLSNKVRVVLGDETGVWIGFHWTDQSPRSGLAHYDRIRREWAVCALTSADTTRNINDLALDSQGRIWAATEHGGAAVFDQGAWRNYTVADHLPSNDTFGLTIDSNGNLWLATWEGIARFDGARWDLIYSVGNGTLVSNHVHHIAFDSRGDIWVAYIHEGVSHFDSVQGQWIHYNTKNSALPGLEGRRILVRPANDKHSEEIWVATADGGLGVFRDGEWSAQNSANGLPSNHVNWVTLDSFDRVWAATTQGVAYFDDARWTLYHNLATFAISFTKEQSERCPPPDYHVWTATIERGLSHSRIPLPVTALDVLAVKYFSVDGQELAQPLALKPGEKFRVAVTVRTRAPYRLQEGDALMHRDPDAQDRFGAFQHMIPPKGQEIEPGQPVTFTDFDSLFTAPALPAGVAEKTFSSNWQVWLCTRYTGPVIPITFSVKQ